MMRTWLVRIACVLVVCSFALSVGCNAFSAERNRRRMYTVRTDLDRMVDDVDWILGLDRPTKMYDPTKP